MTRSITNRRSQSRKAIKLKVCELVERKSRVSNPPRARNNDMHRIGVTFYTFILVKTRGEEPENKCNHSTSNWPMTIFWNCFKVWHDKLSYSIGIRTKPCAPYLPHKKKIIWTSAQKGRVIGKNVNWHSRTVYWYLWRCINICEISIDIRICFKLCVYYPSPNGRRLAKSKKNYPCAPRPKRSILGLHLSSKRPWVRIRVLG